jgi:hypothetical protein
LRFQTLNRGNNIIHRPERLGHASGRRRGHPERLVNVNVVVAHEVDGQRLTGFLELRLLANKSELMRDAGDPWADVPIMFSL